MPNPSAILRSDFGTTPEEAYFTFRPRPDQPERFDEQRSFYYAKPPGVCFMVGGNGAGTTEIALAKVAKFILSDQPAPRKDTPFWIISDTFEQVCEVAWKEKLFGHGHIPAAEIDRERIVWRKELRNHPHSVPLKPWPTHPGTNWVLDFKSYKEGRRGMQARSLGGFCFIEQFPWALLTEVYRGCREYAFRGNKICEFTPIEPGLTEELEEMLEKDTLPLGWEVYRANTQCALEAGHVTQEWFDTFFAMVPESMRETRMTGAMPTYEGAIYSTFNPKLHCIEIADRIPQNVYHRRAIDWGSGPDNAFGCLWYFMNSVGQCMVYDEYYSVDLTRSVIDHLCAIQDQWPWPDNSEFYGVTWADPSATGYLRIAMRLSQYAKGYKNMNIVGANNSVTPGIEHVQYMLKPQKALLPPFPGLFGFTNGWPKLFIDRNNCTNLKREMRTYRWEQRNRLSTGMKKDAKPQPQKIDDHLVDSLRYGIYSDATWTVDRMASLHKREKPEEYGVQLQKGRGGRGVQLKKRGN